MFDRKTYKLMEKKYGKVASWAVWCKQLEEVKSNMDNMDWAKDENRLCSILNPRFVFVGLNLSESYNKKEAAKMPWKNFHSGNPHGNSFKIRYALTGTPFWGAYMTDLIKQMPDDKDPNKVVQAIETKSKEVVRRIKKNKALLERNLKNFESEISLLGGNPVLVVFGNDAYKLLRPLGDKYKIVKLPHYSSRENIPKEQYRKIVLEALKPYRRGSKK